MKLLPEPPEEGEGEKKTEEKTWNEEPAEKKKGGCHKRHNITKVM